MADIFDDQEFYELMQSYRCAPMVNQKMVIDSFEAVKKFARKNSKVEILREAVRRHSFDASDWNDGLGTKLGRVVQVESLLNMADDIEAGIK